MPTVGFEPTIPASARPQTYALDRAATGIGKLQSNGAFSCDTPLANIYQQFVRLRHGKRW
jgi:hypothetical protein